MPNRRRQPPPDLSLYRAEAGPEDGEDPRDFFDRRSGRKPGNRKALQLCEQVHRALNWAIGGEVEDPVLRGLEVASVRPNPTSARLLVTLTILPDSGVTAGQAAERLGAASGMLRALAARDVHRRKAPELTFKVVDPG